MRPGRAARPASALPCRGRRRLAEHDRRPRAPLRRRRAAGAARRREAAPAVPDRRARRLRDLRGRPSGPADRARPRAARCRGRWPGPPRRPRPRPARDRMPVRARRSAGQAILIVLMALAFAAIVLARRCRRADTAGRRPAALRSRPGGSRPLVAPPPAEPTPRTGAQRRTRPAEPPARPVAPTPAASSAAPARSRPRRRPPAHYKVKPATR